MKQKALNILLILVIVLLLASIIILVIGLYYSFIKAGIPYQDPTPELQMQYEINYKIGNVMTNIGSVTTVCNGIICAMLLLMKYFLRKES